MKATVKNRLALMLCAALLLALTAMEIFKNGIFGQLEYGDYIYMIATRITGAVACIVFMYIYSVTSALTPRITLKAFLVFLPCMAVAVNNFPFIPFLSGEAYINGAPIKIALYALACLSVGLFEEMAFRGCIFTAVLQRVGRKKAGVFWAIVISSVIFGAVHIVNVIAGASFGAVILQIGYSFLIGGMCAVILVRTRNIWYCVILHSVYNFAGGVVPECGGGVIWTLPEIILTAAVAVAVASYVIYMLVRITPDDIEKLLNEDGASKQNNDKSKMTESEYDHV